MAKVKLDEIVEKAIDGVGLGIALRAILTNPDMPWQGYVAAVGIPVVAAGFTNRLVRKKLLPVNLRSRTYESRIPSLVTNFAVYCTTLLPTFYLADYAFKYLQG